MKTFYLTMDIDLQVEVPVQANSLDEAIAKVSGDYIDADMPNLNDGDIYDTRIVRLYDENYNVVKDFTE